MLSGLIGVQRELNEHQLAWECKDWDKVSALADAYKTKSNSVFFSLLTSLNQTKDERCVADLEYSKYAINNNLSGFIDCIDQVQFCNLFMNNMSDQSHYNYLLHSIPKGKRFSKKNKVEDDIYKGSYIKLLQILYNVNVYDANMYYDLLEAQGNIDKMKPRLVGYINSSFLSSFSKNKKEQKLLRAYYD